MPEQLNKQHHTHRRWKKMVQLIKRHYSSSSMDNSDVIIITHLHPVTALRFHQCKIIIDRWNNSARTVVETGHTRKNNVRVLRTDNSPTVVSINVVHLHLGPMEGLLPLRRSLIDNATTCTSKNQNLFILSSSMINLVTTIPTATMITAALIHNTFSQQARVLLNHRASQCTWTINP